MTDKPAFPHWNPSVVDKDDEWHRHEPGMTFREWQWTLFAAAAPEMPNALYCPMVEDIEAWKAQLYIDLTDWASGYADAMMAAIAEREQDKVDE